MIKYSIIIPARNAAGTIKTAVKACTQQEGIERSHYEIIVVDDGSSDETALLARQAGADKVIQHECSQGAGSARNSGLNVAQGELIFFTDADCCPTSNWLLAMCSPFPHDSTLVGCKGIYASSQREIVARFVQLEYEDKYDKLYAQSTINFIDTYSAAYRRDVLLESGGFDTRVFYVEDQELSFRLAANDYKMAFQPQAVVFHLHSATLYGYARKKYHIGFWKAQIMRLYPERIVSDSHTPQIIKVQMGLVLMTLGLIFGSLFFKQFFLLAIGSISLFLISTIPFVRKAWRKDKQVALFAPFLLFVRAFALGLGYALGMVRHKF